jgi:hypothetical protein
MFRTSRILLGLIFLAAFQYSASAGAETFKCTVSPHEAFLDQANRFVLAGLRYQPVEATQAGYHGDDNILDTQLDDASPATIGSERALLISGRLCFAAAKASTPEEVADLALLRDNIESTLFQLEVLQGYRYRPQDYVEMIGSGLFFPLTSTDGTEQSRLAAVRLAVSARSLFRRTCSPSAIVTTFASCRLRYFFAVFIPLLGFILPRRWSQRRKRSTGSLLSIPR